jgi:hypothetical protein
MFRWRDVQSKTRAKGAARSRSCGCEQRCLKIESPPSSSAKADDPVFQSSCCRAEGPRRTGYPACEPVKKYGPHPEELAEQASRRMDATHGLAVILRDARKGALLRMRSEIYSQARKRGIQFAAASRFHRWRLWDTGSPAGACHRAALRADPVAGDDSWSCGAFAPTKCFGFGFQTAKRQGILRSSLRANGSAQSAAR